eukprot:TRINITY_DN660_c0_g2_i1.p2 TRINITY_DN660_c0_g2~~TRINITY_DN660_c0_g2_i1.p2  ORF type:complete len:184 (+),score=53.27 TRINITY_DN660_c0_g2_i1:59-553(+)
MKSFMFMAMIACAAAYKCPGSPAEMHASCEVTATVSGNCSDALTEIKARLNGVNGWSDPHNGGNYTLISADTTTVQGQRTTGKAPHYLDKFTLVLTPSSTTSCVIVGCSESQGSSFLDASTNYCNMRNLYCGTAAKCKPVKYDFVISNEDLGTCVQHDPSACVV